MIFRKYSQTGYKGSIKTLLLLLFICSINNIFSQTSRSGTTHSPLILPQGYGIPLLNAEGSSAIDNNVSNISFVNPATISEYSNYSLALSYQAQTSISEAWAADIGTSRVYNVYPQSVGGVFHYKKFSFGVGFGQKFNGVMDVGRLVVTTTQNPDGTGEFIELEMERQLHNFSIITAYDFENIFSKNSALSLGLKYNLNNFVSYERIGPVSAETSIFGSNLEFGAVYNYNFDTNKNIQIGISYNTLADLQGESIYNSNNELNIPDTINRPPNFYPVELSAFNVRVKIPANLRFDVKLNTSSKLKFLGSVNSIFWSNVSENIKNQFEFSASTVYFFSTSVTGSAGLFTTGRSYKEDYYKLSEELNAVYITAGLGIDIGLFNIDIAIADSHLFSGDYWEQTIGKITLGITL